MAKKNSVQTDSHTDMLEKIGFKYIHPLTTDKLSVEGLSIDLTTYDTSSLVTYLDSVVYLSWYYVNPMRKGDLLDPTYKRRAIKSLSEHVAYNKICGKVPYILTSEEGSAVLHELDVPHTCFSFVSKQKKISLVGGQTLEIDPRICHRVFTKKPFTDILDQADYDISVFCVEDYSSLLAKFHKFRWSDPKYKSLFKSYAFEDAFRLLARMNTKLIKRQGFDGLYQKYRHVFTNKRIFDIAATYFVEGLLSTYEL